MPSGELVTLRTVLLLSERVYPKASEDSCLDTFIVKIIFFGLLPTLLPMYGIIHLGNKSWRKRCRMKDLAALVNQLRAYSTEREWFEFKGNWFEPAALGEYISAISNSAAYTGRKEGYFIWGINNTTHEIDGTSFDPDCDVKSEPLKHYLARQISPENNLIFLKSSLTGNG